MAGLGTIPSLGEVAKGVENQDESHDLALAEMGCHNGNEWREWRGSIRHEWLRLPS